MVEHTITINDKSPQFAVPCMICGESISIWDPRDVPYRICSKCKEAVMYIRKQIKEG